MSELIDRQALKDAVRRYAGEPIKAKDKKCQAICLDMLGTIDAQPTASTWHRVEDWLPDKYTQCLVADADGKCAVGYYRYDCKAWDNPAFGWIEMENRIYIDDIPMGIGKVVAWMPIEPPKEDA